MTQQATTADPAATNGKSTEGQSKDTAEDVDAGVAFAPGEAEALGYEPEKPAKKPVEKDAKKTDDDVRAEGESADDAGDEPDGESAESVEKTGEESNEADTESEEETEEKEWAECMRLAKGDPKKALKLAKALYGVEDGGAATKEETPKSKRLSEEEVVARFNETYDKAAEAKDPDAQKKALAAMLKAEREAAKAERDDEIAKLRAEARAEAQAEQDIKALSRVYPKWGEDRDAIKRHYATLSKESGRECNLAPLDVYRNLLQRRAERGGPGAAQAAAKKVEADKKAKEAAAAGGATSGRPAGPGERKHVSTEQREMEELGKQQRRRLVLP